MGADTDLSMAEEKKNEADKKKPPLDKMLVMQLAFSVVNLAVMGWGGYLVYASTIGWHPPVIEEQQLASLNEHEGGHGGEISGPLIYTMDKFTVNLNGEPRRTIRIEVNLEMLGKDGFEEIINTDNRAKARDRIVRMLNERTFSDLESIQGKLFLKDKIAMEINGLLDQGVVKDVYFSEFVVQ
jgi:flagellar FliL protein